MTLLGAEVFLLQDVLCFLWNSWLISHSIDGDMTIWSISSVDWTRMLLLLTFINLRSRRSLCNAGLSLNLYCFRICSLFRTISFTRWITWSLSVFNVCTDWWWNWSSYLFNKLLFAFTAQTHRSLQHYCAFISSVTAEKSSFSQVVLYSLVSSGKRVKGSASVLFLPASK